MKIAVFISSFLFSFCLFAQENLSNENKYYEDQFYVGLQYNSLIRSTKGIENNGVPYSFEAGFIKDIPFNQQRNIGLGLGIGYSYDVLRPSISITENNSKFEFAIDENATAYRYETHNLEVPFEFRWRTSTATTYSFWRIYTGASFIYSFKNEVSLNAKNASTSFSDIDALNKINYTLYSSIGYGTWNFHIKYYLKSPFKNTITTLDNQKLNFNQLKIGVMFYIL